MTGQDAFKLWGNGGHLPAWANLNPLVRERWETFAEFLDDQWCHAAEAALHIAQCELTPTSTHEHLMQVATNVNTSGDANEPFFYLSGPMTGIAEYNFPEFRRIAARLRTEGKYNLVSPADLDVIDGETAYTSALARDLIVCSLPMCVGGIFMPGWEESNGAVAEADTLSTLGKQLWCYEEVDRSIILTALA